MKISVVLEALTGSFETDIGRASKATSRNMKRIRKDLNQTAKTAGLAFTAAAGSLAFMVKKTANAADDFAKLSKSTGVAVESLSQLEFAAEISGTNMETLSKGLARLSRNASDAANGLATPQRAFDFLNISILDVQGNLKPTEELLLSLADRFSTMADGTKKAALAQELFGRSGTKLIPLLNEGRAGIEALKKEADALGLTFDTEASRAAEQFNDNLKRLTSISEGFQRQLTQALLPALEFITEEMIDANRETGGFKESAVEAADKAVKAFAFVMDAADGVARVFRIAAGAVSITIGSLARGMTGLAESIINGPVTAINLLIEQANRLPGINLPTVSFTQTGKELQKQIKEQEDFIRSGMDLIRDAVNEPLAGQEMLANFEKFKAEFKSVIDTVENTDTGTGGGGAVKKVVDDLAKAIDAARGSITGMVADQQMQIDTFGQSESAILAYRLSVGDLSDEIALLGDQGQVYSDQLIDQAQRLEQLADAAQMAKDAQAQLNAVQSEAAAVYEATRTPLENLQAEIVRLNELRNTFADGKPLIDQETYERAVMTAQDTFDKIGESGKTAFLDLEAVADAAASNMQNALADFLFDPFENGIDGMLKSFADAMRQMAAQALAQAALEAALGVATGGASTGGSALMGLFGGARATGGPVRNDEAYLIGERGPELFIPNVAGNVMPNRQLSGGGNATVNMTVVTQDSGSFMKSRAQIENDMNQSIKRARRNS